MADRKPSVLIVEDVEIMRELLKAILVRLDYEVVAEASDGREGVDLAIALEPDLILLDVMMPKMNGYLALEEIIGRCIDPFVVMLSGVDDDEVIKGSMLAGAQGFLQKTDTDKLVERLAKYRETLIKKGLR